MARGGKAARGGSRPEWESDGDTFPDDEAPTVERTVIPSGSFAARWEEVHADELMIVSPSSPPPPHVTSHPSPIQIHLRTPMPVAFDVEPPTLPSAPTEPVVQPTMRPRTILGVAAAMMLAIAVLDISLLMGRSEPVKPIVVASPPAPIAPAVEAPEPPPVPAPAPTREPTLATTGTVIGAEGHRLYIDGHLAPDWRAEVKCGTHVVKVGSQGIARTVDVPCGGDVTVSAGP